MPDLADGEAVQVKGSSGTYELKNVGGVYSCTCPAWRHQSLPIEKRSCKHLKAYRGADAEAARVGAAVAPIKKPVAHATTSSSSGEADDAAGGPPILLAHRWENDIALEGWWLSEKLDGVRAYWDGQQFLSRLGNLYLAPDWFTVGLPQVPLDGELWVGRKMFQKTTSIVRRADKSDEWKKVTYVVFDAPAHKGPFEERLQFCHRWMDDHHPPHARWHEHLPCKGLAHLKSELARVEALGGEGLMLRKPGSLYEVGRSHTLLKVKTFHDAEAKVVAHVSGAGKHAGRLGALLVEMPDGTQFSVGTGLSDAERESPPAIGTIICYRYQELSDGGVPRFPSYVGVRDDVAFKSAKKKDKPKAQPPTAAAVLAQAASAVAPIAPIAPPPPPPMANPGTRRFELAQGGSAKFWEVALNGAQLTVRFGRLGSPGQQKTKVCTTSAAAEADAQRLVGDKTREGYVEKS